MLATACLCITYSTTQSRRALREKSAFRVPSRVLLQAPARCCQGMPVSGMPVSKRSLQAAGGDSGSPAGPAQEWAADVGAAAAAPRPQDEQQPPPAEHGPQFKQPDRLETQPGQCTEAGSSEVPEGCSRLQPTPASMRCGSAMSVGTPGSLADRPPRELSLQLDGQQPAPLAALLHTVLLKKEGER